MTHIERFQLLFEFENWANRRVLAAVESAENRGSTVRLLSHILAGQEVWLTRLQGSSSSAVPIWPALSLTECERRMDWLDGELNQYLRRLTEEDLDKPIEYSNQHGATYTHTPMEILTHLGLHSQHHRGQIALQLRQHGEEPAVTDFIAFRRQ